MTAPHDRRTGGLDLYRALFEHARAAILLADDHARFVDANPAACGLLGYPLDELLALSVWDVSATGAVDQGQALWRQFIEAGQLTGEYLMRRKDGTTGRQKRAASTCPRQPEARRLSSWSRTRRSCGCW